MLSEGEAAHRMEMVNKEKERRKRKEKEAQPIHQLPGCSDDNPTPSASDNGIMQRKSVFLSFMCRDLTLLTTYNRQLSFRGLRI